MAFLRFYCRANNVLKHYNITSNEQLCAMSEQDLLRLSNFGRACLVQVKEVLASEGLSLAPGPDPQPRRGKSPTPLQELFGAIAVPLCEHPRNVVLRVWHDADDGWHASWGIGGSVGGRGATPEDAILAAHKNFISLRDRNALRARVADVKKKIRRRK